MEVEVSNSAFTDYLTENYYDIYTESSIKDEILACFHYRYTLFLLTSSPHFYPIPHVWP